MDLVYGKMLNAVPTSVGTPQFSKNTKVTSPMLISRRSPTPRVSKILPLRQARGYNALPLVHEAREGGEKDAPLTQQDKYKEIMSSFPQGMIGLSSLFTNTKAFGISGNGPYWDHVLGYWKASVKSPEEVLFLVYEDLKKDTVFNVKKLAEFMGYPFTPEEERRGVVQHIVDLCSFDSLRNLKANKSGVDVDSDGPCGAQCNDFVLL
ncbi:hypothetical protein GH714_009220 [Hevea brasiliensis]|uniref:Sulfotransferase n=1 Tax=Hevea brasiliensis TaxID=3981 RepID=A0A6A6M014_HEVBR|nr:hypothetical protein GH714_009220 [Hevea brasiliensis]